VLTRHTRIKLATADDTRENVHEYLLPMITGRPEGWIKNSHKLSAGLGATQTRYPGLTPRSTTHRS
jgi:hypothetical protein